MDLKYAALNRSLFKHTNKPGLIKEYQLINYLPKCSNRSKLVKEIVYCLLTKLGERIIREEYRVAYNSCSISDWTFKVVYSKVKYFKSLKDLIIIDISILESNREDIFSKYNWFKEELIRGLEKYGE